MNPRLQVDAEGRVLVRTGKVEIGQGLHTALAQIVADAMGVPLSDVRMLPVDTQHSPDEGVTSGSLSVQDAGAALRKACAEWREGSPLAEPESAREVGTSPPALSLADKLAGRPAFIHDMTLPGLLHGRVLHPPRHGMVLAGCELGRVQHMPGVSTVVRDGQLLGVVASTSAQADAAAAQFAASVQWLGGSHAAGYPAEDAADLQTMPAVTRTVAEQGQPTAGLRTLRARYTKPWVAHASIAPSCALAQWQADELRVWTHSQGIFNLRRDLALAFGTELAQVRVTHAEGAGCYGHNGADDVAFDAAWLARQVPGCPVRVLWTRADELSHSPCGPAMVVEMQGGTEPDGTIAEWHHDVWSPGHSRRPGRSATPALLGAWQTDRPHAETPSIDMPLSVGGGAERNAVPGYDFTAWRVRCHSVVTTRRSSALRSLGAFANVYAAESFMDEIAHATGADPLALRRRHLQHDPRAMAVLDAVAARVGWRADRPAVRTDGIGQGLAFARYKGTGAWCAVVAEVQAGASLQVRRLTIAVDVGLAVNPGGVANQIEGGAIQATSWVLKESAAATHAGWDEYPILRFTEVPMVDVIILPSQAPSLGAGEAALGPTAAAIANALFDALGVRVRDLPLTPERIIASMDDSSS